MRDATMTANLHRLIYVSRQIPEPGVDLDQQVEAILHASIRNNREVGITGLLLVHQGWFIQALEGSAQAVTETYLHLFDDPRHENLQVLIRGSVEGREFGDWNMCARRLSAADDALLDAMEQRKVFDPQRLSPRFALRLLKAVRTIQQRTVLAVAA
jgi:hypothetical protein